jgi:hypothetical protein
LERVGLATHVVPPRTLRRDTCAAN